MDYSLAQALSCNMQGISNVVTFYDISCSYMKKFHAQVQIIPGIGIWHVHGHHPDCYSRYAFLKTLWSLLNTVSSSTWDMTFSHWQELLDFQMNDSNFMKIIRMIIGVSYGNLRILPFQNSRDRNKAQQKKDMQHRRMLDPLAMDIYNLHLPKDICLVLYHNNS
ncbi:hypothetical protein V8E55_005702 [Tylopilus felleus]